MRGLIYVLTTFGAGLVVGLLGGSEMRCQNCEFGQIEDGVCNICGERVDEDKPNESHLEPMNHAGKVDKFHSDLVTFIDNSIDKYGMTLAEVIGVLEIEKMNRFAGAKPENDETEEDDLR